jgi:hypothetical protein
MDWWKGSSEYDPATGLPKGTSSDSKTKSDNYTRLVWKAATKVGFGVEGSWAVAWVCGVTAKPTVEVTKANVPSTSCTTTTTTPVGKYDSCFNKMMLDALNKIRTNHVTDSLILDTAVVPTLHDLVAKSTRGWSDIDKQPTDVTLPAGGKYAEVWFYSTDSAKIFSSAAAVDGWYKGQGQYDYTSFKCKRSAIPTDSATMTVVKGNEFFAKIKKEMSDCNNFRNTIWK